MEEIDIWRTAQLLIRQHGEQADLEAAMRADVAIGRGNAAAEAVWKRILKAIQELSRGAPGPGDSQH